MVEKKLSGTAEFFSRYDSETFFDVKNGEPDGCWRAEIGRYMIQTLREAEQAAAEDRGRYSG